MLLSNFLNIKEIMQLKWIIPSITLLLLLSSCRKEGGNRIPNKVTFESIFVEKMPNFLDTIPSPPPGSSRRSSLYFEIMEKDKPQTKRRIFDPVYHVVTSYSAFFSGPIVKVSTTSNLMTQIDSIYTTIDAKEIYQLKIYHEYEYVPVRAITTPFPDNLILLDVIEFTPKNYFPNRNNQFILEQEGFKLVVDVSPEFP